MPREQPMTEQTNLDLLVILDTEYAREEGVDFIELVRAVRATDSEISVMLRMKELDESDQRAMLSVLSEYWETPGTIRWLLNASPGVETPAGIAGRHWPSRYLGETSVPSEPGARGFSVHSAHELSLAKRIGAAWVTVSPYQMPHSKDEDRRAPLGKSGMRSLAEDAQEMPVYALGGVTPADVAGLRATGVSGVAILGPIHVQNPAAVIGQFLEVMAESKG